MESVRLSHGEQQLVASIIEHVYPDPKTGSTLPIEHGDMRSARGLERKGVVTIHIRENYGRQAPEMTFTALGESVYEHQRQNISVL